MKLVLIVLNKVEVLDELLEDFVENGIHGATIINSTGMASELFSHHDLNIFYSLRNMMEPTRQENKTIYLVIEDEKVERVYELADDAVGGFDNPNTGIFVSLPVDFVRGVHKK